MYIALNIIGGLLFWTAIGVTAHYLIAEKLHWRDSEGFYTFGCIVVAPIMLVVAVLNVIYQAEWEMPRFFNKKTPIIDGYKWGDLIKVGNLDGIFVGTNYNSTYKVLLKGETSGFTHCTAEEIEPVMTGEVKEELKLFKEAQELERRGKEFIAQAIKVRKQQKKVRNIMD